MYRYLHQLLEAQNWLRQPGIIVKTTFGIPASKRRALIADKGSRCVYCQATENLTLDHKLARALGGDNTRGNLQVLCQPCNKAKAREETELLAMLGTESGRAELLAQWKQLQKEGKAKGRLKNEQRALQRAEAQRIIDANRAAQLGE